MEIRKIIIFILQGNTWSKIRSSPLVRVVADGGSKNEMMPAFFVQSCASSALDGPLETGVGPM